jgi:hydrogenase nickel incorporation protein HypA/HybF
LLYSAWEHARDEAALEEAILEVEEVPLEAACRGCGDVFQPVRFSFRCPTCGSTQTDVVRGDGVILDSMVLDELQQGAAR